ncbi:balbiani_ring protein [Hexamita inflata]|uniref:Balbiani ring protein n=1 Tax=Hexamita inflata TaxID=28002 RepID=A0AA86QFU2_9EUKA|nr:balbiani ring protein [Hexamita inflata]
MLTIISTIAFQVFSAADFEFCYNFVFQTPFQETLVINEVISFDNPATREACKQTTNVLFKETTKPIIQLQITGQVHVNQAFSLFHYIYSDIVIQDTKLDLILIDGTNADVSIVNWAVSEYKIEIFQSNISISSSLALNSFMLLNTEIDLLINRSQIQYTLSGTISTFYGISKELFGSKIENTTFDYQVTSTKGWAMVETQIGALTLKNIIFSGILSGTDVYGLVDEAQSTVSVDTVIFKLTLNALSQACAFVNQASAGKVTYKDVSYSGIPGSPLNPSTVFGSVKCPCFEGAQLTNGICYCTPESTFDSANSICKCDSGLPLMNGLCKCPQNSILENSNCVCQPTNSVLDNGICACDSNSFKTSMSGQALTCQACPGGATSDSGRTTCICSGNYYYKSDNTCNKCPDNSVISNNVCVCDSHSYEVSSSNGLPTCFKCPDSATPDQSGKTCTCQNNNFYTSSNNTCTACGANSTIQSNVCVCNANSYEVSNNAGSLVCFTCPVNSVSQNNSKTCLCNGNYFYKSSDNICVECPADSLVTLNVCACISTAFQVSITDGIPVCKICPTQSHPDAGQTTCICDFYFQYNSGANTCQACPLNNYYVLSSNSCIPCDSGKFYNTSNNVCVTCLSNSHVDGNGCTCNSDSFQVSKVDGVATCTQCLVNSAVSGTGCVCNADSYQTAINNGVTTCVKCPSGSSINVGKTSCDCTGQFFYDPSKNLCIACLVNSAVSGAGCVCNSDSYQVSLVDGVATCVQCPAASTPDSVKQTCVCANYKQYISATPACQSCPLNNYYVIATNSCTPCPANQFYNSSNNVCVACLTNSAVNGNGCTCNSDSFQVSKVDGVATCTKCPASSAPDAGQTTCVCNTFFQYISSNNTCQACPLNYYYILTSNSCVACPLNKFYDISSNGCVACLANSAVSGTGCVCNADSYQTAINNGVTTCVKCPSGSSINVGKTSCDCTGQFFYDPSKNLCIACLVNSAVSGAGCVCNSDSYQVSLVDGVATCVQCPAASTPDSVKQTCVCANYKQYISATPACQSCPLNNYYVIATNSCTPCPANQFYNSSNNVCVACLTNSAVNGNGCTCNSDSFQVSKVDGVATCTKCPASSAPDAGQTTCVCNTFFQYISSNNTCQACPYNNYYVLATNLCVPCPMYTKEVVNNVCVCHDSANTKVENNICTCNMQYAYIEFVKASTPACWCPYYSYNNSVKCICNTAEFIFDVGMSPQTCVASTSCTAPRTVVNSVCTCNQATGSCPTGATWDVSACKCKCTAQYKNGNTVLPYSFWGLVEGTTTSSNMKCCSSDKNYGSSTQQSIYYQCQDSVASIIYSNNNNKWVCGGDTCQQFTWTRS